MIDVCLSECDGSKLASQRKDGKLHFAPGRSVVAKCATNPAVLVNGIVESRFIGEAVKGEA